MVSSHEWHIEIAIRAKALNDGCKVLFDADIFCVCLGLLRHNYLRYPGIITGIILDVFTGIYRIPRAPDRQDNVFLTMLLE